MNSVENIAEDVELSFLSILLKNGKLIEEIVGIIFPYMFSGSVNRDVFTALVRLSKKGIVPSAVMLKNILISVGKYSNIGGDTYLGEILSIKVPEDNLSALATEIQKNYKRRELYSISKSLKDALESHKEPDMVTEDTIVALDKLATSASPHDQVIKLESILDESLRIVEDRMEHPGLQGITTGFSSVDDITTGYLPAELWFIGARPSMGKTALLLKSGLEVAKSGVGFLLINREMGLLNIPERLCSMLGNVDFAHIRNGRLTQPELEKVKNAKSFLDGIPFYIDNNWDTDGAKILPTIKKYCRKYNIKVVGIDYIQLFIERDSESTHELGQLSRNLKLIAGELGITIVILSQLNRKVEERIDKRPIMSDLRQSGNLEEDADYMVALYRDSVYNMNSPRGDVLEFIMRKARNAPLATVDLGFSGRTVHVFDPHDIKLLGEK